MSTVPSHAQELAWADGTDEEGESFKWYLADPVKIVQWLANGNKEFKQKLMTIAASVCHVILYLDEITPGNILSPDNKRTTRSGVRCLYAPAAQTRNDIHAALLARAAES